PHPNSDTPSSICYKHGATNSPPNTTAAPPAPTWPAGSPTTAPPSWPKKTPTSSPQTSSPTPKPPTASSTAHPNSIEAPAPPSSQTKPPANKHPAQSSSTP